MSEIEQKNAAQASRDLRPIAAGAGKVPPLALLDLICWRQPGWGFLAQYEDARVTRGN